MNLLWNFWWPVDDQYRNLLILLLKYRKDFLMRKEDCMNLALTREVPTKKTLLLLCPLWWGPTITNKKPGISILEDLPHSPSDNQLQKKPMQTTSQPLDWLGCTRLNSPQTKKNWKEKKCSCLARLEVRDGRPNYGLVTSSYTLIFRENGFSNYVKNWIV
jgi:hypothetical protein